MQLTEKFREFIEEKKLFSSKDRLILAVSGGLDSAALCELCHELNLDFVIAHCNFQLRGKESQRDEEFVLTLGKKYDKKVFVNRFDTEKYAEEKKLSVQVAARELRYKWFNELADSLQMMDDSPFNGHRSSVIHIATAHHLDDNIETLLMHFFRGTGIAGLRGMPMKQGKIVRPLLFAKKEELKAFALSHHLNWVEDSSNETDKYSRNYFRHQFIPILQKIYPEVMNNLAANTERFRDIETLYLQSIEQHKKKLLEKKGNEIHIPVLKLKKTEALVTVCYEIMKEYGFSPAQTEELIRLSDSESGKYIQSETHRILKNRNWLIISPKQNESSKIILIEEGEKNIEYPMGYLHLEIHPAANSKLQTANSIASLDASQIRFPILLRKWKAGDYFYPMGLCKKKKLSRFFIDNKLSRVDKEKVWVLEMNKKIIWVIGMRIDDRFKITPKTRQVLKIEMRVR